MPVLLRLLCKGHGVQSSSSKLGTGSTGNWEHWEQGQPWAQPQAPHRRAKSENTPGAQGIQEQHTPPGNDKTSTEGKGSLLNAKPLLLSGCWDQS